MSKRIPDLPVPGPLPNKLVNGKDERDSDLAEIIPKQLYLASAKLAGNHELLKKYGITYVLNVGHKIAGITYPEGVAVDQAYFEDNACNSLAKTETKLEHAYQLLSARRDDEVKLVHCAQGISRSPSVIIYYLKKKFNYTYEQAETLVKSKRKIKPNDALRIILKRKK